MCPYMARGRLHDLGCLFIYDAHRWQCEGMFPLSDLGYFDIVLDNE